MPNDKHKDRQDIVLDLVDDAIITDPYAVTGAAFELFIAGTKVWLNTDRCQFCRHQFERGIFGSRKFDFC
jgi:hypothetical protein